MRKPKIDDKLRLMTDFGETEAICAEVLDDPTAEGGTLLKVMARGPFQEANNAGSSVATDRKSAPPSRASSSKPSTARSPFQPCSLPRPIATRMLHENE